MRLSDAARIFLQARSLDSSPKTVESYALQYRLLQDALGDPVLAEITTPQLRQYLADAQSHLKASSLNNRIKALRSLWKWLVEEEYTDVNPMARIKEAKVPPPVPKALTSEEIELLRDACRTPREHALIELFFATGARLNELSHMNRTDIDWQNRAVRVMGKGRKERECYFGHKAALWLQRYLAQRTDEDPALFVTLRQPHRRMANHTLYGEVKRIARRIGLDYKVSPHTYRHSLATNLLDHGADVVVIQSLLGHSKPETTLRYLRLSGERRRLEYDRYFMQ